MRARFLRVLAAGLAFASGLHPARAGRLDALLTRPPTAARTAPAVFPAAPAPGPATPIRRDLFPAENWHNHGSCLVEHPRGGLLACWFHGSGERTADDVRIEAAWLPPGARAWSPRFTLDDTPGYPDCNPSLFVDPDGHLWFFHPTILDHHWESALLKSRHATDWRPGRPPRWDRSEVIHVTPGPDFAAGIMEAIPRFDALVRQMPLADKERRQLEAELAALPHRATNLLSQRLGWMPRAHAYALDRRLILPLYSDGYSISLMAYTDDDGATWRTSGPLIGAGNIQPSLARRRAGTLVAFMRDNGPPPKRLQVAESRDRGETWGPVTDSVLPNPGSGAEVLVLRSGRWAVIGNDTEDGRHSLAVWLSDDEGRTWRAPVPLERAEPRTTSFAYPSLIQARDGSLHATYSVHLQRGGHIRHTHFSEAWLLSAP